MTRVATRPARSTRSDLRAIRRSASAASRPRSARRARWTRRRAGDDPDLVDSVRVAAVDERIASRTTAGRVVADAAARRGAGSAAGPRDGRWPRDPRGRPGRRTRSAPSAARSSRPSRSTSASPNRAAIAAVAGSPGPVTVRATCVGVDDDGPPAREVRGHGRLAAADRAGQPDPDRRGVASPPPSRGALLELEPGLLGRRQRDLDVGELARDPRHLDVVRGDGRVAERQLEVALAQAEPGQVGIDGRALAAIGVLRELRSALRPGRGWRRGGACPAAVRSRAGAASGDRSDALRRAGPRVASRPRARPAGRPAPRSRSRPSSRRRPRSATPDSRRRTATAAPSSTTHSFSQTVSSRRRSWDTTSSVAGDSDHERLDRLARRDVEVVGRFVEQQQVGGLDPEQRQLEPRPLAAGQRADLLERVVAAEQEAGQVGARLALGDRDTASVRASSTVAR